MNEYLMLLGNEEKVTVWADTEAEAIEQAEDQYDVYVDAVLETHINGGK